MQLYNRATGSQRFLTFIIDLLITGAVIMSVSMLILFLTKFDFTAYNQARNEYITDYILYIQYQSENYYESFQLALQEYYSYSVHFFGIIAIVALFVFVPYFVVLPKYWSKQTVGRLVAKVKVISHKGKVNATTKQLIFREILGTWFIYLCTYFLMSGFLIVISAFFAAISGRSLVDRISGTDLVQKDPITVNPDELNKSFGFNNPYNPESSQFNPDLEGFRRDDSIDAEVKDVTDDKSNDDYSSDDNYNESNDSDDEYQVF